jgi:hypothetical protein
MPVSLSPLHKSIKEFDMAVLKVDSELEVFGSTYWLLLIHNFYFELTKLFFVTRFYRHGIFGPLGEPIH